MYPSPLASVRLPLDGDPFCLYMPGGPSWSAWYQNRSGHDPQLRSYAADALADRRERAPGDGQPRRSGRSHSFRPLR